MTLALNCACGAHLVIDDKFAGQTIQCPDCQRSIQAPALAPAVPLRTSGLALTSLILALVGAFTVLGTLLAVALGVLALRSIGRHADRLTGRPYAVAGIFLGLALTGVSLFAYLKADIFGLDSLLRAPEWAGKLDFSGPGEVVSEQRFVLSRPSQAWGVYHARDAHPPSLPTRRTKIILVDIRADAQAIVFSCPKNHDLPDELKSYRETAVEEFGGCELVDLLSRHRHKRVPVKARDSAKEISAEPGREIQELLVDLHPGRHDRTFILRVIHDNAHDAVVVVAAGARKTRFAKLEPELRKIINSFKADEK